MAIATLSLAACGGGGGGGGSTVEPPPPPPPSGGITRTGVAIVVGPISGFGSVIVNGVRYDTTGAEFFDDDVQIQESELEVGEVVFLKGTIEDDNSGGTAERVEVEETVEGPVSTGSTASRLVVLGQIVAVGLNTSVDDSCPALDTLAGNASFDGVEVFGPYALVNNETVIDATRVECKLAGEIDEFEINGVVSNLDSTNRLFDINGLRVDYDTALVDDNFPGGTMTISEGDAVEVKGTTFDDAASPPVLTASKVEYKGNQLDGNEGDHLEIEGFITDFVSATDFRVLGVRVTTVEGETNVVGGGVGDLNDNLKVEVEGEYNAEGVLVATEIEIKDSKNIRVTGLVDSIDSAAQSLVILGITVTTEPNLTRFEDKVNDSVPFGIGVETFPDGIVVGNYVEVRGQESPPGEISAVIVERDDGTVEDTELRGFVESFVDQTSLTILGVTVGTTGAVFRNESDQPIPAGDFWAAINADPNRLVDVNGTEIGDTQVAADEVSLENENDNTL